MRKRLTILLILITLGAAIYTVITNIRNKDSIKYLSPQYEVEDYQFIADGNGIVIDWKITNKWELSWYSNAENTQYNMATSKAFLIQEVVKLRNSKLTNQSKRDEYFYLDIFDLRNNPIKKKRIDLWALVPEELKEDHELFGIISDSIFVEDGSYYGIVILHKKTKEYPGIAYLKLNLETGLLEGLLDYGDKFITNPLYDMLDTIISIAPVDGPYYNVYQKTENYDGQINLAVTDETAAQLFSKEHAVAYQLVDIENLTVKNNRELIDLRTQFLPIGTTVYDVSNFTWLIGDEKENRRVTSFEEFEQYHEEYKIASQEKIRRAQEELAKMESQSQQNQEGN